MKELLILSGKGGTGKTTVAAALVTLLSGKKVLADADVEAANLSLVLGARPREEEPFYAGYEPQRDETLCRACGLCREKCRFEAISEDLSFDPFLCEGCGVCAWFCPEGAISMREKRVGSLLVSETDYGPLVHAELIPGEENSGKLVAEVKKRARSLAEAGADLLLVDGPPGVACPVIASLSGAEAVLVVAEPSPSGLHDLERLSQLLRHFRLNGFVVVNKADLCPELAEKIFSFPFLTPLGRIPFDEAVPQAVREGLPLPKFSKGPATLALKEIARKIEEKILNAGGEGDEDSGSA